MKNLICRIHMYFHKEGHNNAINQTCSTPQKLKFFVREATQVIATPLEHVRNING